MPATVFERQRPTGSVIEASLETSVNRPFWIGDVADRERHRSITCDRHADLAIVGGGYLGLWCAILAKERDPGTRVTLVDAARLGGAASGRNGGFCEASITHGEENARKRWPEDAATLLRMGMQNLEEFERTLDRYGIDCDFERTGSLQVATESYQITEIRGPHFLSRDEVRAELASPTYLSGAWNRDDCALVHPGKLAKELARVARQLGVEIFEHSAVSSVGDRRGYVALECAGGTVTADRAVLATNAFPSLLKSYRRHTIPVYDYVLMTEPLSAAQMDSIGWRNRQGVSDLANQFHYYRLTRDNRILFGGYDAIYHFGGDIRGEYEERPQSFRKLASHFFTTFPQLIGLNFTHRWAGVIDTSTRFCAFYGRAMEGRVAHAAGFTGLGVGATRFAANVMLDMVHGLDTERTKLRMVKDVPMAFPPEPLTYAAVSTVRRALDRADHDEGRRGPLLRTLDALGLGFDS